MQQTNKYKLNKPGLDDPVAIAPLNENMDKLEAALIAEAKSRADADTAEANARTAAIQAEASARASAVTTETNTRIAAVQAEAKTRADADTAETNARNAAIQAEAKTRASADTTETNARIAAVNAEATARANADNALSQRVTVLEAKKLIIMKYMGDGSQNRILRPGFTPKGVLYLEPTLRWTGLVVPEDDTRYDTAPIIVDGGVQLPNTQSQFQYNQSGYTYRILMFT